jgi:AraC-like DNA-binding protein
MTQQESWPEDGASPPMGSLQDATFLRMWDAEEPHAGSLPSYGAELDGPWHFHDMHQLMCAFEGSFVIEVERGRHLVPCQLAAWIPAGLRHRVSLRKAKSSSIFFPPHMVARAGDRIRAVIVSPLMREMIRTSARWPLRGPEDPLRTRFFDAMAGFCSEWIDEEADLFLPTSDDKPLQKAMDHAARNLNENIADICQNAGISERSLRRKLKQATGMTLHEFRNRHRLVRAVALLSETDSSVGEIAYQCGYESPSAFSRVFRATMREAPREYRSRMREPGSV